MLSPLAVDVDADADALDPNFAPPTRPPSALSTTSDTSYFALYEEPAAAQPVDEKNPPAEYLPRRIVVETIRRHGWACLLCGRKDDLAVVRAVLQHGHGHHSQHGTGNGNGNGDEDVSLRWSRGGVQGEARLTRRRLLLLLPGSRSRSRGSSPWAFWLPRTSETTGRI